MTFKVINFYPEYGEIELSNLLSDITFKMMLPIVDNKYVTSNISEITASDSYTEDRLKLAASAINISDVVALIDPEGLKFSLIIQRNKLLLDSDWTQLPDVSLPNVADWRTYRQTLRDVPKQTGFPTTIIWPIAPQ